MEHSYLERFICIGIPTVELEVNIKYAAEMDSVHMNQQTKKLAVLGTFCAKQSEEEFQRTEPR